MLDVLDMYYIYCTVESWVKDSQAKLVSVSLDTYLIYFLIFGNLLKKYFNTKYLVLIRTPLWFHCAKGGPWIYPQIEIEAHCATYGTPIVAN